MSESDSDTPAKVATVVIMAASSVLLRDYEWSDVEVERFVEAVTAETFLIVQMLEEKLAVER